MFGGGNRWTGVKLAYSNVPRHVHVCVRVSKARRSAARSNRAESRTTYRINEGGNEKVIFTNFSERWRRSVSAVCAITGNICKDSPSVRRREGGRGAERCHG